MTSKSEVRAQAIITIPLSDYPVCGTGTLPYSHSELNISSHLSPPTWTQSTGLRIDINSRPGIGPLSEPSRINTQVSRLLSRHSGQYSENWISTKRLQKAFHWIKRIPGRRQKIAINPKTFHPLRFPFSTLKLGRPVRIANSPPKSAAGRQHHSDCLTDSQGNTADCNLQSVICTQ